MFLRHQRDCMREALKKMLEITKPSSVELRELRKRNGQVVVLHAITAMKAFGRDAVLIAENNHTGFLASDDRFDYYLGQQIEVKLIKNKPNANRN